MDRQRDLEKYKTKKLISPKNYPTKAINQTH